MPVSWVKVKSTRHHHLIIETRVNFIYAIYLHSLRHHHPEHTNKIHNNIIIKNYFKNTYIALDTIYLQLSD